MSAPTQSLIEIVYASGATIPFDRTTLAQLLQKARIRNEAAGVTGILIHVEGSFLQVLEGEPTAVEAAFARIALDPRHNNLLVLRRGPIDERRFADWRMGFVGLDAESPRTLPGFSDFVRTGVAGLRERDDRIARVLDAFREGSFRRFVE